MAALAQRAESQTRRPGRTQPQVARARRAAAAVARLVRPSTAGLARRLRAALSATRRIYTYGPGDGRGVLDLLPAEPDQTFTQRALHTPLTAWFYDRFRETITGALNSPDFATEVAHIQQDLQAGPGDTILDLACGQGNFTVEWAKRVGPAGLVIGLDLSMAMLERAAYHVHRWGLDNVLLIRGDAHQLPFADGVLHKVNCSGGFHQFPDLPQALREIARVSAPGAALTASTFAEGIDDGRAPIKRWLKRRFDLHFVPIADLGDQLGALGYGSYEWLLPGGGWFGYTASHKAALVTFFAVRIADRLPDEHYRYGYGKVENLSALVETLLLLITCVWIIYEAIQRLFFTPVEIEASLWAFGVMLTSIVVDVSRSRILYRAARKHNGQALEADALHFSTDIWSSSVVIVGLGLVWLSGRLGPEWAWLVNGDAVATLVVAAIVVYVSLQLGKRAVVVLLDVAPPGLAERIATEAAQVPGVQGLGEVRLRQAGAAVFVDLVVNVDRSASLEEAHQVAEEVDDRITHIVPRGDVVVHVDPVRRTGENLSQAVSAIAARLGLRTHDVHAHEVQDRYFVDLHVEVPADLTLGQAHDQVSHLELAVREELPQVRDIHSHIEPLASPVVPVAHLDAGEGEQLRARITAVVNEVPELDGYSRLHIRPGPGGYDVVLHCLADPDLPVAEAHRLADQVEKLLHVRIPGIKKVLVHVTPEGEIGPTAQPGADT